MGSVSLINGHIDDDKPIMTPQEAIDFIENEVQIDVRFCGKEDIDKIEEAFELAISALEKQIPKKPIITDWVYCPNCNWKIAMLIGKEVCPKCGQVLDWSDVK